MKAGPVMPRLMRYRQITPSGCWEWTGARWKNGYGRIQIAGKSRRVHRVSFALHAGIELSDLTTDVLHRCDNPPCFNPDHLFLGSQSDNALDSVAKGRWAKPGAVVTPDQVREIRARYAAGGITQMELAAEYGLGRSGINFILTRHTWKEVE